ncbi:hypothetical protein P691DRAFT_780868 [Macrolepiota fuliginosa MF-IS2]|uniref:Uncharacterized protein n=1 Tax=Macrolepiota fuliginosa MF-IS2 TaxID=1400762 RepID=A0A9P5XEU9_9AGAR|nr:hypothetical protein P691DRAFT_780868 [Macrolepiota fuliginosa MF-IS2]
MSPPPYFSLSLPSVLLNTCHVPSSTYNWGGVTGSFPTTLDSCTCQDSQSTAYSRVGSVSHSRGSPVLQTTLILRVPNTIGPSTNTDSVHPEPVPSAQRQSATSPPLAAISPVNDEVETVSTTFTKLANTSTTTVPRDIVIVGSSSRQRSPQGLRKTIVSPVSSAGFMKIINETNIEPGTVSSERKRASASPKPETIEISPTHCKAKGKGKAKALPSSTPPTQSEPYTLFSPSRLAM